MHGFNHVSEEERMADVKMPESKPCQYDNGWAGRCGRASDNGWCSQHEDKKCAGCGDKAIKACDQPVGGLNCGAPLCGGCKHSRDDNTHVTRVVAEEALRKAKEEREALLASRTSPVQWMNEVLGVPMNLFELLKGDTSAWPIKEFYHLELNHGLMGFFPAIVLAEKKRLVLTIDRSLLGHVWRRLEPRDSKMGKGLGYVNESLGFLYPNLGQSDHEKEDSKPLKILSEAEYIKLTHNGAEGFGWAPGLIGPNMHRARFEEVIEAQQSSVVFASTRGTASHDAAPLFNI